MYGRLSLAFLLGGFVFKLAAFIFDLALKMLVLPLKYSLIIAWYILEYTFGFVGMIFSETEARLEKKQLKQLRRRQSLEIKAWQHWAQDQAQKHPTAALNGLDHQVVARAGEEKANRKLRERLESKRGEYVAMMEQLNPNEEISVVRLGRKCYVKPTSAMKPCRRAYLEQKGFAQPMIPGISSTGRARLGAMGINAGRARQLQAQTEAFQQAFPVEFST